MKVLVADDEATNRLLLKVSVTKWGHEPVVAQDGKKAWEILSSDDPPPIVLMDWMMPGMDGTEVCRRLRDAEEPRLVYIIMVTTNARPEDIISGLQAGADDYVTKPFDLSELRARFDVGVRVIGLQERLAEREKVLGAAQVRLAEEERLHAMVASMTDGIVTADSAWRITYANRAGQLLLNLDENPAGASLADALGRFGLSVPLEDLMAATQPSMAVEIARTDTEVSLYLDGRLSRRFNGEGELVDLVLTVRDVTDQRAARNVEASFLNSVSHKLRTPLAVLRGYLNMLSTMPEDRSGIACEQIIPVCLREADRLDAMVERLLQFRDLSTEEKRDAAKPVDVAAIVAGLQSIMQERYPEKRVEVTTEVEPGLDTVAAAAAHADIVVEELVDNAVKFATQPVVKVQIRILRQGSDRLAVSVADNGPGIPHEYLDRIFEGYVQVEEHVTGQIPGFGLGLRIVKEVVEGCGGEVTVQSDIDEGSTVQVTIPLACERVPPVV